MFETLTFSKLGVRSLANTSRARQFNPLNPPGVGWVPLPQTNMAAVVGRARSWAVVRAWSVMLVVRGRRARPRYPPHPLGWGGYRFLKQIRQPRSVVRGRARSCAVVRSRSCVVVRGRSCVVVGYRSCVVVRGRGWSVVRGRAWSCRAARFADSTAMARTNERTNEQHLITH